MEMIPLDPWMMTELPMVSEVMEQLRMAWD